MTETVLDRDARAAMAAYLANPQTAVALLSLAIPPANEASVVARAAYSVAAAMAAERRRLGGRETGSVSQEENT